MLLWGCEDDLNEVIGALFYPKDDVLVEWISFPTTTGWICYSTTDSCDVSYKEPTVVFSCDTIKYHTLGMYSKGGIDCLYDDGSENEALFPYPYECRNCVPFDERGECDDCYPERYSIYNTYYSDDEVWHGYISNGQEELHNIPPFDCTIKSCVYEILIGEENTQE